MVMFYLQVYTDRNVYVKEWKKRKRLVMFKELIDWLTFFKHQLLRFCILCFFFVFVIGQNKQTEEITIFKKYYCLHFKTRIYHKLNH